MCDLPVKTILTEVGLHYYLQSLRTKVVCQRLRRDRAVIGLEHGFDVVLVLPVCDNFIENSRSQLISLEFIWAEVRV